MYKQSEYNRYTFRKRGSMAIQTELFKEKDTQIVVRCKESLKVGVQELAKENGLSLSGYVKYLLIQELKKSKK